jgi:integrase
MEIFKENNNTWTMRAKIKCNDELYHQLTIRGYAKKSLAVNDFESQKEKFKNKFVKHSKLSHEEIKKSQDKLTYYNVINEFLTSYGEKNKKSSQNAIRFKISNHITDFFESRYKGSLDDINKLFTEDIVIEWKKYLIGKDLNTNMKNQILTLFKNIIKRASIRDLISNKELNKCLLQLDHIKSETIEDKNVNFWTIEEYLQFINTFDENDIYHILFDTLYYTGVRISELCGLQWKHFNREDSTLKVMQQRSAKSGTGKREISTPKSKAGARVIDLPIELTKELEYLQDTIKVSEEDFIFNISQTTIKRVKDEHIKLAGVKHIRLHDFRHSHASLMIYYGCDAFFLKTRLGHATIDETMKTYAHMFPNKAKAIVSNLNQVLLQEKKVIQLK